MGNFTLGDKPRVSRAHYARLTVNYGKEQLVLHIPLGYVDVMNFEKLHSAWGLILEQPFHLGDNLVSVALVADTRHVQKIEGWGGVNA